MRLSDGRTFRAKTVISNATRWDTFGTNFVFAGISRRLKEFLFSEKLIPKEEMPQEEVDFQKRYRKAPSFLSIHMGVKASALPPGTECHHLLLEV